MEPSLAPPHEAWDHSCRVYVVRGPDRLVYAALRAAIGVNGGHTHGRCERLLGSMVTLRTLDGRNHQPHSLWDWKTRKMESRDRHTRARSSGRRHGNGNSRRRHWAALAPTLS